jgi:hypothetical protein
LGDKIRQDEIIAPASVGVKVSLQAHIVRKQKLVQITSAEKLLNEPHLLVHLPLEGPSYEVELHPGPALGQSFMIIRIRIGITMANNHSLKVYPLVLEQF